MRIFLRDEYRERVLLCGNDEDGRNIPLTANKRTLAMRRTHSMESSKVRIGKSHAPTQQEVTAGV